MSVVSLSGKQRTALEHLLRTSTNARQVIRAQALVWLDDGEGVEEVADRLAVSRQTVYNWSNRFKQRDHLPTDGRVADGIRSGRPPTALEIIDPLIDAVIDADPRTFGLGSTAVEGVQQRAPGSSAHRTAKRALLFAFMGKWRGCCPRIVGRRRCTRTAGSRS